MTLLSRIFIEERENLFNLKRVHYKTDDKICIKKKG